MEAYNESLSLDKAFFAQDIAGSIAWARANKNAGILTGEELQEIERGFQIVRKEWETNAFDIKPGVDEVSLRDYHYGQNIMLTICLSK